jgi:hypothetical protein
MRNESAQGNDLRAERAVAFDEDDGEQQAGGMADRDSAGTELYRRSRRRRTAISVEAANLQHRPGRVAWPIPFSSVPDSDSRFDMHAWAGS